MNDMSWVRQRHSCSREMSNRLGDILVLRPDEQQVDSELLLVADASSIRLVEDVPSSGLLWFLSIGLTSLASSSFAAARSRPNVFAS